MSDKYKFRPTGDVALDAKLAEIYQWANEKHDAIMRFNSSSLNRIRVAVIEQESDLESDLMDRVADVKLEAIRCLQNVSTDS